MPNLRLGRTRVLLSSGILLSGIWVGALALLTDTADSPGTFTTGTVDLTLSPATTLFNVANMAPGDVVYAGLTVKNSGSLQLRYDMSSSVTNTDGKDLGTQLTAEIKEVTDTCEATTFQLSLDSVALPTALSSLATIDHVLAAGASQLHCYKITLPLNSGNAFQDATTTATFTFNAEQTANN